MAARTTQFPTEQSVSEERKLLTMILDNAHIHGSAVHGKNVMTVLLTRKQIDHLHCYGIEMENLEGDHEQEDAA